LLRKHYLKALEEGDYNALPSSMQGRGMLSNYAKFLGLDEENLLLQFAEGVQAIFAEKQKLAT
jgi:cytoskeletal protein RodZ